MNDLDYKALYLQLLADNQSLRDMLTNLNATLNQQTLLIQQLQQQLEQSLRARFGKKSERSQTPPKPRKPPTKPERDYKLPETLEREEIIHEVLESEKNCPECDAPLKPIKPLINDYLAYRPAKLYVKRHLRHRYACQCCKQTIITAKMQSPLIEKGSLDATLAAQILIDKYQDHLPLYRQENRWLRLGYALPRQTLCDWAMACADWLKPIVAEMRKDILLSKKISSDDTVFPILAPGKVHKGRLWVYIGGGGNAVPIATIYEYTETRSGSAPLNFLKGFSGYLQADAYAGYDQVYAKYDVIAVACLAHARRKFNDALESTTDGEINQSLSATAISFFNQLYHVEHKTDGMTAIKRKYYRRRHAKPILKRLHRWLRVNKNRTFPKSTLGKAINYTLNHWRAFNHYCRDGSLDIDNNISERAMKTFVIGRKNYLFAGSHRGAEAAATIYSIIETCKMHNINTYDYLTEVLSRLPNLLNKDLRQLLPYHWRPGSVTNTS